MGQKLNGKLDGLRIDEIIQAANAAEAELARRWATREKPSERLNRTGERRLDPRAVKIESLKRLTEKERRDLLLLPTLMIFAIEAVEKAGDSMDPTMPEALMNAARIVTATWPILEALPVADGVARDAQFILRACGAEHARQAMAATALMVSRSVDDSTVADPDSVPVLLSAAILQDAQEEGPRGPWDWNEVRVPECASRMAEAARLRGYL